MAYKVMDLFSGAGGFSTGMQQAGFKIIGGVDFDRDAAASFRINHRVGGAHHAQMSSYTGQLGDFMKPYRFRGEPNVVIGGPPCQAFSTNGERDPNDPRTKLYLSFVEFVVRRRPLAFVMENVANLPIIHGGRDMQAILRDLKPTGYHISFQVINAWEHGLPQARKRTVIVGSMFPGFRFPAPIPETDRKTVRDAIGDLPLPTEGGLVEVGGKTITMHRAPQHTSEVVERIKRIPEGGRLQKVQAANEKKIGRHNTYGRLRWDEPALVITTSSGKPSSTPCIHPEQHRAWTLREAARLQGFPDDFEFVGGDESIRRQIGNAVPPRLGSVIGEALLRHFADHQESVEAALLIRGNDKKDRRRSSAA